ncbi:unnamed protein product [Thelazia callipaeda]|uniref:SSD domain-containing protein n=1 Tax=Thelazia callipaeda TaxID=103827 RepID=A0A158RBT0_THECL|nr:unnamed protein product [Thelazia callipaeda]
MDNYVLLIIARIFNVRRDKNIVFPSQHFNEIPTEKKEIYVEIITSKFDMSLSPSTSTSSNNQTRLVQYINELHKRWSYFLADHVIVTIVLSVVLSIICAIKVINTSYETDVSGFVPYGVRSRYEFAVQEEFTNHNGKGFVIMAVIIPKDNGSMLREELLQEAVEVDRLISNNFTLHNHINGQDESFSQFCLSSCVLNIPLLHFQTGFQVQLDLLRANKSLNDRIDLRYPVSKLFGRSINIQMNFNGVKLRNDTFLIGNEMNESTAQITNYYPIITNMVSVKMLKLLYRSERIGDWTDQEIKQYELSIARYFQNDYKSENIRVFTVSFNYVGYEIARAGLSILPYLIVGFCIMFICSTLSTLISATYMQQMTIHKIYLPIFACICPLMANATAIGLLITLGIRYDAILCITPFLALAIGVDDAYLMMHAWQRTARECTRHPTKEDSVAYRLSEVLQDTGPAILISALTNILADAVGTFTGSPNITILCFGNMTTIFMDYVYQLTFYSAILCISGHFEMKSASEQQNIHSIEIGNEKKGAITNCCGQGITQAKIELTSEKLFPMDSPLIQTNHLLQAYQVPEHTVAQFYVSNPGNLSNPLRLDRLNQMVSELEHLKGSWGPESTNYFIRDFIDYEKHIKEEDEDNEENGLLFSSKNSLQSSKHKFDESDLPLFLDWPEYQKWQGFLNFNETTGHLRKFIFTTSYYGENLKEWPERGVLLNKWRSVIDKYNEFNVSVYMDDALFLDLIDNMATDIWQSALGILLCMAFICFIFLYDIFTVIVVSAAILSILTSLIGLINFAGINLEPIMVSAMLISMGFSVDIPAHVAYHYNSAGTNSEKRLTVKEKLRICFASVALPALQASFSSSLCLLGLAFKPLYMAQVFVNVMVLCIFLCVLHGLLIIPCMLVLIDMLMQLLKRWRNLHVVSTITSRS